MTSAVKVEGEPLYKKAHQGIEIPREPRTVCIYSIHLVALKATSLVFTCTVSRGTYIRVLGEDIATKLGTVGHLLSLRRLSIGSFLVDQAKKIGDLNEKDILDPTLFITTMKHVEIDDSWLSKVQNGQALLLEQDYGEKVLLVLHGEALAVYHRRDKNFYLSERGLF
jgi:tRNA pseudouridine55 synthase